MNPPLDALESACIMAVIWLHGDLVDRANEENCALSPAPSA